MVGVRYLMVLIKLVWILSKLRKLLDVVVADDTITTCSDETNWLRCLFDGLERFALLFYPYQGSCRCEEVKGSLVFIH